MSTLLDLAAEAGVKGANGVNGVHETNGVNGVNGTNGMNGLKNDSFDAFIVGAGFAGMRMLYELRKRGVSARVFDAASGVGGVSHIFSYLFQLLPGSVLSRELLLSPRMSI